MANPSPAPTPGLGANPILPGQNGIPGINGQSAQVAGTDPITSGIAQLFQGSSPIFTRIGVGAAGVGLMITGLIVMGLSSRAASAVANDLVGGGSGTVVGTVAKAAV